MMIGSMGEENQSRESGADADRMGEFFNVFVTADLEQDQD